MFIMIISTILILILSGTALGEVCPKVKFFEGKLVSTDSIASCVFETGNDPSHTFYGNEIRSYSVYGLIKMDCGICQDTLVSVYSECRDCTFCLHNEYINGCKAIIMPILIALLITMIFTSIISYVCWILAVPTRLAKRWKTFIDKRQSNKMEKRERSAKKLLATGLILPSLPPRDYESTSANYLDLSQINLPEEGVDTNDGPSLYPRQTLEMVDEATSSPVIPTRVTSTQVKPNTIDRPSSPSPKSSKRPQVSSFNRNTAAALILPALMMGKTNSCDITAYVSSSNQIYRDVGMTELYTGVFMIESHQTVCLRYFDNSVDRIVLSNTWLREIYTPIYRTSDFEVKAETKWNCMGAGVCWDGYCQIDSVHPDWDNHVINYKYKSTTRYGCFQSAAYCSHCTYNKQCVYYHVSVIPKGDIYTVYKMIETDWVANIVIVRSDGSVQKHELSSKTISAGDDIKIGLTGPSYSIFRFNEFLVRNNIGLTWSVIANNLGDLSSGLIGDFQIGLYDESQTAFMMTSVICQPNSCLVRCISPESGLLRGLKQYRNYSTDVMTYGDDVIMVKPLKMSFNAYVTSSKSFGINVIEAACTFQLQATYGCTACNKPSVAYLQAKNIRSNGLIKFTSNCTLDTNVLSCQEDPQEIKISGHQQNCAIHIKNQTLILAVDYIFEGQVYSMGAVISSGSDASVSQMTMAFMTNPNFLTSVTSLMTIAGLIGVVLTIIRSITKYSALYLGAKAGQGLADKA
ncbi:glycoprotein precursor [Euproctis pseudoconspersa bunyavirus]|uniref:Glycoprotein n=1 Tax=Euproctis pseudoconspersa bunyavirus TaxID=2769516 RepID=A0A7H0S6L3_9VIRU|nr:glycoprotein precursor [Euproctis pseudoconspersa bunyavirus]QNQ79764.1 glycoprotein precursor [Euproctis pseudoconspersa bunyavirus]